MNAWGPNGFDWKLNAIVAGVYVRWSSATYRGDVQSLRSAAVEARLFRLCDLLMMF